MLFILMFVAIILGLIFSWGPDFLSLLLSSVGSFNRLSWFSLIGTAVIAIYWIVFSLKMYRYANSEIIYEEDETEETEEAVQPENLVRTETAEKREKSERPVNPEKSEKPENKTDENVPDEITEKVPKFGKKSMIFGILLTVAWIALFVTTDLSAVAADNFAAWQNENANMLQLVQKIGHLLLAFAAGIFVSIFHRLKRSKKKGAKRNNGNASSGNFAKN